MERFEHLSMVTFLILGLALVRLMTSYGSLFARNVIANEHEGVDSTKMISDCEILDYLNTYINQFEWPMIQSSWSPFVHHLLNERLQLYVQKYVFDK